MGWYSGAKGADGAAALDKSSGTIDNKTWSSLQNRSVRSAPEPGSAEERALLKRDGDNYRNRGRN